MKKLSEMSIVAYIAIKGFIEDFNTDEQGLSGVVATVLLILVAVLAVVFIWGGLNPWLRELWDRITEQGNSIS